MDGLWICLQLVRQSGKENLIVLLALDVALFILSDYLGTREGTMYGVLLLASNYFLHIIGAVAAFSVFQRIANVTAWKTNKVVSKLIMYSMKTFGQNKILLFLRSIPLKLEISLIQKLFIIKNLLLIREL